MKNTDLKKQIIIFDLDGTLTPTKSSADDEMSDLLSRLLQHRKVAVMSGSSIKQFRMQFLDGLKCNTEMLSALYLFPTCATSFYVHNNGWTTVYEEILSKNDVQKIMDAFEKAFFDSGFKIPDAVCGELIEDRGSQVSFSAFGQKASRRVKEAWDPDGKKRLSIKKHLDKYIPEFETRVGGTTTIDVTRKGIDKAYGITQIEKHLGISKNEMLFVGDSLFEGGNDYPVKACGVDCIPVSGPEETKEIIKSIIDFE